MMEYLAAFADVSLVLVLNLLLLSEMAVEQILLQRPSAALLSQQSLRLTVVLFELHGSHKIHSFNTQMCKNN